MNTVSWRESDAYENVKDSQKLKSEPTATDKKGLAKIFNSIQQNLKTKLGNYVGKKLLIVHMSKKEMEDYQTTKTQNNNRIEEIKISFRERNDQGEIQREEEDEPLEGDFSTTQKLTLDGLIVKPSEPSSKYIVIFNGMKDNYEKHLKAALNLAEDVGANVVVFNYRGVGESDGRAYSAKDLIEDGNGVLEYLQTQYGVEDQDISLYGHSMGGGVVAKVQETHKECSFVTESSFKTFSAAVTAKKGKIFALLLRKSGWNLKPSESIKKRDLEKTLTIVHRHDPTVPYSQSLYKAHKNDLQSQLDEGVESKMKRIKIGSKTRKLGSDQTDIDIEPKTIRPKTEKTKKVSDENLEVTDESLVDYSDLKKRKLVRYLYHPHTRIMDRVMTEIPNLSHAHLSDEDKDTVNDVNQQFHREDLKAYESMVGIFKEFLNI